MLLERPRGPEALEVDRLLFVEGANEASFDRPVLQALLRPHRAYVQHVGGCDNVIAAAHALTAAGGATAGEPGRGCYAVVDRDDRLDEEVERAWAGGPFADGRRHLIWRRHELENYFLEPAFVCRSAYIRDDFELPDMWDSLTAAAQQRVFLDAANLVLMEVRVVLKRPDLPALDGLFSTRHEAVQELTSRDYGPVTGPARDLTEADHLSGRLDEILVSLFGGPHEGELQPDRGDWIGRMSGKHLINEVLSPRFFQIDSSDGAPLQGPELWRRVGVDLMERLNAGDLADTPPDLLALRDFFRDTA